MDKTDFNESSIDYIAKYDTRLANFLSGCEANELEFIVSEYDFWQCVIHDLEEQEDLLPDYAFLGLIYLVLKSAIKEFGYDKIYFSSLRKFEFIAKKRNSSEQIMVVDVKEAQSYPDNSDTLIDIQNSENKFWKGLPMLFVISHFEVFTKKKSTNGKPFLTEVQFISFLKKGFLNDTTQQKQKINCSSGEKGL